MNMPCSQAFGKLSLMQRHPRRNESRNKKGQGIKGDILGPKNTRTEEDP